MSDEPKNWSVNQLNFCIENNVAPSQKTAKLVMQHIEQLQSRIASLEEREKILKQEKETLGNDLDEAFDLVYKSDFVNQKKLLSILERNDNLYGF